MKIAVPRNAATTSAGAASPDSVKKLVGLGFDIVVESGAGEGSNFSDESFREAGAAIAGSAAEALGDADIVLKIRAPRTDGDNEIANMKKGAMLMAHLSALVRTGSDQGVRGCRGHRIRHGASAANHSGSVHGHPVVAKQPRRL